MGGLIGLDQFQGATEKIPGSHQGFIFTAASRLVVNPASMH